MKILITESQHSSVKEKVIFMLLNKKKYNLVETKDYIFFVKKIGDEYAEIRFDKNDAWCYISYDLMREFSLLLDLELTETKELIGKWVESTLQMKVSNTVVRIATGVNELKVPYK